MNYKKYNKKKKLNKLCMFVCSCSVYLIFIFYVLQILEFANVIEFKIPYTNLIMADKIYLKALLATLIGNRVLGICYHAINIFILLLLGYSAICTAMKNKLAYTFYYYIPLIVYSVDIIFGIFSKKFILCIVHTLLAVVGFLTLIAFNKMKVLNDLTWGEKE